MPAVGATALSVFQDMLGACATLPSLTPIEIDSAISAVKDLLPELGDGFVEVKCRQISECQHCIARDGEKLQNFNCAQKFVLEYF